MIDFTNRQNSTNSHHSSVISTSIAIEFNRKQKPIKRLIHPTKVILINLCQLAIQIDQSLHKNDQIRLIEDFFVVGVDVHRINKPNSKSVADHQQPSIIYRYLNQIQNEKSTNMDYIKTVPQFCYPKGIYTHKIQQNQQLDILNKLVCNKQDDRTNQYILLLKSERFLENSNRCENEVLSTSNPYHHLYAICYEVDSYVWTTDNKNNRTFYKVKNSYCILSYFPFFDFFVSVIQSYLDHSQKKKLEYYCQQVNALDQLEVWTDLDQNFFNVYLTIPLTLMLDQLFEHCDIKMDRQWTFEILNMNYHLDLEIEGVMEIKNMETIKGMSMVCQLYDAEMISIIILSLLLEKSVVFLSANKYVLTVSIMMFKTLLYPFIWNHPIISILPSHLFTLFDSPVPLIIGLNDDIDSVHKQNLVKQYQKCLFVDIDHCIIYNHIQQSILYDYADDLNSQLDHVYQQYSQQVIAKQLDLPEKLKILVQTDQQDSVVYQLFYEKVNTVITGFIKNRIANVFIKIVINYYRENYDVIGYKPNDQQIIAEQVWSILDNQSLKQDMFLQKLIATQNFQIYFDQLILNNQ